MRVKLLTYTPEPQRVIACAAKLCYSNKADIDSLWDSLDDENVRKFIEKIIDLNHQSVLEHVSFTFAIEGISRACYPEDVEILTKDGWKYIKDVKLGEEVITYNRQLHKAEFQVTSDIIAVPHSGVLHSYKNNRIDIQVTPNHNMFIKKYDVRVPQDFMLIPSENIGVNRFYFLQKLCYDNVVVNTVEIKGYSYIRKNNCGGTYEKVLPDLKFDKELFCKFMAMYLSEGCTYYNEKENKYIVSICQLDCANNQDTRAEIISVIKKMGYTPSLEHNRIKFVAGGVLGKFCKSLGVSYKKEFPFNVFEFFNQKYAKIFIDTYLRYDGHKGEIYGRLFTSSKKLADQLYIIGLIAGFTVRQDIRGQDDVGKKVIVCGNLVTRHAPSYIIGLRNKFDLTMFTKKRGCKDYFTEIPYNGMVYCVTVPNNIIYIRRNGKSMWCGNCQNQLVRHRIGASFSVRSQRYCNEGEFKAIAPKAIANNDSALTEFAFIMDRLQDDYKHFQEAYGFSNEVARSILPNACATRLIVTMNARELMHFFNERCCVRAESEIRTLAYKMLNLVKEVAPALFSKAGAKCTSLGYCPEDKMSCGKAPTLKEVMEVYHEQNS